MKIGICLWSLVGEGGAQREAVYLAKQLKDRGHNVTFYTFLFYKNNPFQHLLKDIPVKFLLEKKNVEEK